MRWKELNLQEAALSKATDEKYIGAVNELLKQGVELRLWDKGESVIIPKKKQSVSSLSDPIYGTIDGEYTYVLVKHLFKSNEIKNLAGGKGSDDLVVNTGEVAEGYHATAAFARLIKRPSTPITVKDVISLVTRLKNNKALVLKRNEVENQFADEFHLTVALKPGSWEAFQDPRTLEKMGKILDSIITDANAETSRFADRFATNQRFDRVRVVGDGVSEESVKKTDVRFENEAEKKFADYSLKVGTTKQIHQVGGGKKTATPQERFEILQHNFFNVDGRFPLADISAIQDKFLKAKDIEKAQELAYKAAVNSLNSNLQTDDQEKTFLNNLVGALKYWMGRDDPDVKLKQFTKSGTLILDANKISQMLGNDQLDLKAVYTPGATPKITIVDNFSKKPLVSFRTYRSKSGYLRNYVEKERLFVELALVKEIPNTVPRTAPVAKTAVKKPVAAPKQPALAVSKPKIGAPVQPKGTLGTTPAPQTGIKPAI